MLRRHPLPVAVLAALAGAGFWIWLTGPGTSVPNALVSFVIAVICGRLAWSAVGPRDTEDAGPVASAGPEDERTNR